MRSAPEHEAWQIAASTPLVHGRLGYAKMLGNIRSREQVLRSVQRGLGRLVSHDVSWCLAAVAQVGQRPMHATDTTGLGANKIRPDLTVGRPQVSQAACLHAGL